MFECLSTSIRRHDTTSLRRQAVLLLCLGVILCCAPAVEAAVAPRSPTIVMLNSADFSEMVFVVYRIKAGDPWATGIRVDPTTAKIVPADTDVELPFWEGLAVLAVPRALAEQTKGAPDPAWLELGAPGVVRVPGVFSIPSVYRDVVLRYRLDKTDNGATLTLLNPEVLKSAQQYPLPPGDATRDPWEQAASKTSWVLFSAGGLFCGLLVGVLLTVLILKRRNKRLREAVP